jgi:adenylate cyclase class 2
MITSTPEYADVTIKARCSDVAKIEMILKEHHAAYIGEDFQTDTYYEEPLGKLKLREGNIENLLTHYLRHEESDKKKTTVFFYITNPDANIKKEVLRNRREIGRIIKKRKIYFIDNVKFHIDQFANGESFVEIEAIDRDGLIGAEKIGNQCSFYQHVLNIHKDDILKDSYIDWVK